jgi:hypothetical protein
MNENVKVDERMPAEAPTSRLIDWFAVGQGCQVEAGGVTVILKVIGQKARRTRLAIVAPAGTTFSTISNDAQRRS